MLATAGILLTTLALPALPQEEEGLLALRREAAFARALTSELGFVDFAEMVLEKALDRARSPKDRAVLLLERCNVRKLAVNRISDPAERLPALEAAFQAYQEFLGTNPDTRLALEGELNIAEIAFSYGSTLHEHLALEEPAGPRRTELIRKAEEIFLPGIQAANAVLDGLRQLDADARDAARYTLQYPALFYRALIYYYWGLSYPQGSVEFNTNTDKAIELLEGFILDVGETSVAGLLGYKHLGDIYFNRGETETARDYYEYVVQNGVPADWEDEGITFEEVDRRREVIQDAYQGWMRMLRQTGNAAQARELGAEFQSWVDREGVILSESGYRVLLELARLRIEAGEYSEAIRIASQVADENRRSILRLEANRVMAKAIEAAPPGTPIDLSILYGAAEGAYFDGQYERAVEGFKLLLSRMAPHSSQAAEFGGRTYHYLGRSWAKLNRLLEATAAYRACVELFPEDEDVAAESAQAWLKIAEFLKTRASRDPVLDQEYQDALQAVESLGPGNTPEGAIWREAERLYREAKNLAAQARGQAPSTAEANTATAALRRARDSYAKIPERSRYYEKALVQQAMCEYRCRSWDVEAADRALAILDDYLERYLPDPENTPTDPAGRKNRVEAYAQAEFYRGQIWLDRAKGGERVAAEKVLALYEGYGDRHPGQPGFTAATMAARVKAWLLLGEEARAEEEYQALRNANLDPRFVRFAAYDLYNHFLGLADRDGDQEALQKATAYLHTFNQLASRPSWPSLNKEAELSLRLGRADQAAAILERVLRQFEDDPSFTEDHHFGVEMQLVDAYLAQDLTGKAAPLIENLLRDPRNRKDPRVMELAVKSLVGYVAIREGRIVEIPGKGTAEAFQEAQELVNTILQGAELDATKAGVNKYRYAPYWHAKVLQAYLLYRWAQVDTGKRGAHRNLLEGLRRLAPDLGQEVAGEDVARILDWIANQP